MALLSVLGVLAVVPCTESPPSTVRRSRACRSCPVTNRRSRPCRGTTCVGIRRPWSSWPSTSRCCSCTLGRWSWPISAPARSWRCSFPRRIISYRAVGSSRGVSPELSTWLCHSAVSRAYVFLVEAPGAFRIRGAAERWIRRRGFGDSGLAGRRRCPGAVRGCGPVTRLLHV